MSDIDNNTLKSLSDINYGFYINLEIRKDRKDYVENELSKINLKGKIERFNAIKMQNGALGCSFSHLKCLQIAKEKQYPYVWICEDDITFTKPAVFIKQMDSFLNNSINWDVILLAGNIIPPYTRINESCVKVNNCQTTTGYIVKSHYYDTLINNFKKGIEMLISNPCELNLYAIDKYWFALQERDNWFLITPLTVTQKPDYSNIERRCTNYNRVMLDLDKPYLKVNDIKIEKEQCDDKVSKRLLIPNRIIKDRNNDMDRIHKQLNNNPKK